MTRKFKLQKMILSIRFSIIHAWFSKIIHEKLREYPYFDEEKFDPTMLAVSFEVDYKTHSLPYPLCTFRLMCDSVLAYTSTAQWLSYIDLCLLEVHKYIYVYK